MTGGHKFLWVKLFFLLSQREAEPQVLQVHSASLQAEDNSPKICARAARAEDLLSVKPANNGRAHVSSVSLGLIRERTQPVSCKEGPHHHVLAEGGAPAYRLVTLLLTGQLWPSKVELVSK